MALRAIEEQHEHEEKRREQEATKVALDRSLKLKLRRKVSGCGARGHSMLCMEHSSRYMYMASCPPQLLLQRV